MKIQKTGSIVTAGVLLALSGCQQKQEASAPASPVTSPAAVPAPVRTQSDAEVVELTPAMLGNVKVETAREQTLPQLLTATGKVQLNEDQIARVLAPMPGQVLDLNLRVGDTVAKDQVLFNIRSRELASLVTDLVQAQRDQDLADKTLNMTRDLYDHQAASRISFQQAEADVTKTKTQVARAEESLRVLGLDPKQVLDGSGMRTPIPVRSPMGGAVIERTVTPGQFVQADATALLTLADMSTVWVMVDVFEQDLHLVHPGQRVMVSATAYPDKRFAAHVDRINDRVDPDTRTVKVRLLVSNPGALLKPEMFINASLALNETTTGVTLPATSIMSEGDHAYSFVAIDELHFERREVVAVPDGEGRVRVTSGIRSGDKVLTSGTLLMRFSQKQLQEPE